MVTTDRFACHTCGRQYRWRPELAGRKVKCKCGEVRECPREPASEDDPESLYEFAPPIASPAPKVSAPSILHTPEQPLPYRAPKEDPGVLDQYFPNRVLDFQAPLWLIGGSVVVQTFGILFWSRDPSMSIQMAIMRVGIEMIVGTTLMLVGILMAAKFRGISFGPFWAAVLKLAAISLAPDAAMLLIGPLLMFIPLVGGLINWGLGFCLYFALLGALFDLDQEDTWYCVCVIFLVKLAVYFGLMMIVFRSILHP